MAAWKLRPFNFQKWIGENQHLLKPPVGNKKVFEDGDMTVQVVGGPNARTDFHDDPVEEFFYQLKGDMLLKVHDDGDGRSTTCRSARAKCFCCRRTCRIRRNGRRKDSVGLVVEAARPDKLDGFNWYCFDCGELVHRIEVKVQHVVKDLPPLYAAFDADEGARKCRNCGALHPGNKPPVGWVSL